MSFLKFLDRDIFENNTKQVGDRPSPEPLPDEGHANHGIILAALGAGVIAVAVAAFFV